MAPKEHPLATVLEDAARGTFPAADGSVDVLPAPPGRAMAVVGFRAKHHREHVQVFEGRGGGVVILGRGLARRLEVAVEVAESQRDAGLGRWLLTEARKLAHPDEVLFVQTAPAHAASLRAALAAGFRPIGSEALFL